MSEMCPGFIFTLFKIFKYNLGEFYMYDIICIDTILNKEFSVKDFDISSIYYEILKSKREMLMESVDPLVYPYETNEFKIYTTKSGRKYEVYRNGRVFKLPFVTDDNIIGNRHRRFSVYEELKPSLTKNNYYELNLGGRNSEKWALHRLIAHCWLDNPNNLSTVDHLDNNRGNNSVENLEWVTRNENIRREFANNKHYTSLRTRYIKWKNSMVINPIERERMKNYYKNNIISYREMAKKWNINLGTVYHIIRDLDYNAPGYSEIFKHAWFLEKLINELNSLRMCYLQTKNDFYLKEIFNKLPDCYIYYRYDPDDFYFSNSLNDYFLFSGEEVNINSDCVKIGSTEYYLEGNEQ